MTRDTDVVPLGRAHVIANREGADLSLDHANASHNHAEAWSAWNFASTDARQSPRARIQPDAMHSHRTS
jgi:hypothetical protein